MSDLMTIPVGRTQQGHRAFSMAYKIEFLRRWDTCVERGAKTRLLRENNLAQGTVRRWLQARDEGHLQKSMVEAADKARDRLDSRDRAELAELRRENERLRDKVAQSDAAVEILGKAFELLQGIHKTSTDETTEIPPALMSAREYALWLERKALS
ncbi:Uncharacterised protein [Rhodococcus rhodochrous]|uniref:hypothetical protein n=2 Tax=Rhodococcus rhodochrous TaxID=1829 RepID=UPI0009BB14FC|nr:hypothetical protein [Rhodococcus rhodochrous]SNV12306.1 Uncharacterised protein [Rhodococcus rhodochrous]SNV15937.1 Uncharacterised protein [Rhodococcus rhodochrous]SNV15943.1 Uncharacterised protein [Rhodococcus rhodochrous]SNV17399.1 Uncharacterised protein [Rhodococcus rhodochrous]SNV19004.1 Uncharacterised protein [Rhodococcus rhodochrous]